VTDPTTESILDATRASVLDFGIRRTTLTDVARRAGVSRMTVYRRYPDVDAVLRDLMTREFGAAMAEVAERVEGSDGRSRVVDRIVAGVEAFRANALMTKVVEAEPELLLPYVVGRMGETQRAAVELVAAEVRAGQRDGSIRAALDSEGVGLTVNATLQGFLVQQLEPQSTQRRWIAKFRTLMEDML
jgi:AcrR family transcriptional regulator